MKKEEIIIQTENVRVRVIELQPAERAPFHFHTEIIDNMFGVSGEIIVNIKNPIEKITLTPGVHCKIEPGRIHQVVNNLKEETSKYLLIQGVGTYDFINSSAYGTSSIIELMDTQIEGYSQSGKILSNINLQNSEMEIFE